MATALWTSMTGGWGVARGRQAGLPRWLPLAALVAGLLAAGQAVGPASAADVKAADTALGVVPDTVAFYSASLRCGEQVKAIAGSRAWAKLVEMPVVKMAVGMYQLQAGLAPASPAGKIQAALNDPEVQKTLSVLGEICSDEIFLCGDNSLADLLRVYQAATGPANSLKMPLEQLRSAKEGQAPDQFAQAKAVMSVLIENLSSIKVPHLLFGFKAKDTARLTERLARMEEAAKAMIEEEPQLKGRLKRETIGGSEYLTLRLDGGMVPWEEVQENFPSLEKMEAKKGDAQKLIDHLKKQKLVIALGLHKNYLLLSIADSTEPLDKLDQGKRLADRPEMRPLAKFAGKRLSGISYLSKAMAARLGAGKSDVNALQKQLLPLVSLLPLSDAQKEAIRKDAGEMVKDLKGLIPEPGAAMGFSFLNGSGYEGYHYDWTAHPELDGSKPLGLMSHVGGDPLAALVGRGKTSVEHYDLFVKWLQVGYRYFKDYAVPTMPPDGRDRFAKFMSSATPLLKQANDVTRTMLLPALADGQCGLVLDAKLQSKQYLAHLPATEKALPMVEPALVFGVTDAALLRKAVAQYVEVAAGLLKRLHETDPAKVPEIKIPAPQVSKSGQGDLYHYALPKQWGVDEQMAPTAGLSNSVAVLALTPKQAERLLAGKSAAVDGVLADPATPRATAGWCDWAAIVEAISPWVDLAFEQVAKHQAEEGDADAGMSPQLKSIQSQVHTVLDLLKVVRNVTAEMYFEGPAAVTHSAVEIRDVK